MKLSRFLLSLVLALFLGNLAPGSFKSKVTQAALPSGQNSLAGTLHLEQGSPVFFRSPPATPPTPFPYKITVVRAYYSDPKMVAELARWLEPWEVHSDEGYLVVGVTQEEYAQLVKLGFRVEIDWQLTDQANRPIGRLPQQANGIPGFPCYRTVSETFASAQALVSSYPQLAAWIDIGDSWDKYQPGGEPGSDLMVLRLTNSKISGPKPTLFIMASIHAREYAPAELATRFAEYMLHAYNIDPDVTWLLDYQEIHLLLQANPDGRMLAETRANFEYTWWRKNTNLAYCPFNSEYRGADLNRNFAFQWNSGGSSNSDCDENYHGVAAASEPETQAIQAYDRRLFSDQRGQLIGDSAPITTTGVFIDLHSYGNLVLWPWGNIANPAPNDLKLSRLGQKFAFFNHYDPKQAIMLYQTSGTTDDFAYGDLGVAAYTFEMGYSFFEDCIDFEHTILTANIPALVYAAKSTRSPYQTPSGPDVTSVVISPTVTAPGGIVQMIAQIDATRYFTGTGRSVPPVIQNILTAEYTIDTPPWLTTTIPLTYSLAALDGSFDQPRETVTGVIGTGGLGAGRHLLYLRGQDADGNWGPFSATFLYMPSIFLPEISK
jgi:carboxypeptidase T